MNVLRTDNPFRVGRWLVQVVLLTGLLMPALSAANELRIAVLVNDMSNPYFQVLASSIRTAARDMSQGSEPVVTIHSSGYSIERQRRQLQEALNNNTDILVVTAAHPSDLEHDIQRLRDTGVIVVAVDVATRGAQITITTHNVEAGFIACTHLARTLDRTGRIAILNGPPVSSIRDRVAGCREALNRTPQVIVVDEENSGASRLGGMMAMTRLLTRQPELDGVFVINDPAAQGAEIATRFHGRTNVGIASIDGSPDVVSALRAPDKTQILNTAAQFPRQIGRQAVRRGIAARQSGSALNETVLIPAELIHADNAHRYCAWRHCADALSPR